MLGSGFKSERLRVNLRLVMNRLKLLEKKKTEMAQKSRKEIADYLSTRKDERARIRVEHIIREDYLVEAMEILELYCDLLLARYGIIQTMKDLDPGLAEAVSSLIWAAPRLQTEVPEMKIVASQLCNKYSKEYGNLCRTNQIGTVSERLMHKLGVQTPPKILVEKYLIEIAKNYNVQFEPDARALSEAPFGYPADPSDTGFINDDKRGGSGGGSGRGNGGGAGGDFRNAPFSYPYPTKPESSDNDAVGFYEPCQFLQPPPRCRNTPQVPSIPPAYESIENPDSKPRPAQNFGKSVKPKASMKAGKQVQDNYDNLPLPKLPSVPVSPVINSPTNDHCPYEDVDFEDLSKRLDELKKKT